jgi:hypothetical protein
MERDELGTLSVGFVEAVGVGGRRQWYIYMIVRLRGAVGWFILSQLWSARRRGHHSSDCTTLAPARGSVKDTLA